MRVSRQPSAVSCYDVARAHARAVCALGGGVGEGARERGSARARSVDDERVAARAHLRMCNGK